MRLGQSLSVLCVLGLMFVSGCGGPTHESVTKDMIAKMNELTATLHGITDEASAKASSDKLKSIVTDLKGLKTQADALPKPTPEEDKALKDKYGKDLDNAMNGMMGEMMRIQFNPALSGPVNDSLKGLQDINMK